jgi:hypothetical protein
MPSDGEPSLAEAIKETCLLTSSYLGYFASFDYRLLRLLRSIKEMDGFLAWSGGGNTLDCYVTWVSRCVEYSVDSASECQEYMRLLLHRAEDYKSNDVIFRRIIHYCSAVLESRNIDLFYPPEAQGVADSGVVIGPQLRNILGRMLAIPRQIDEE